MNEPLTTIGSFRLALAKALAQHPLAKPRCYEYCAGLLRVHEDRLWELLRGKHEDTLIAAWQYWNEGDMVEEIYLVNQW